MADVQVLKPGEGPLDRARLAAGMHLINVALHAANVLLLFLVLRAMTASMWPSALVAALFAVHPLHVESVAWITERKDVLSGLFGLLALGAYAWYARGPSVLRYLSVAAALALGLMAKPMLVTWPLVFLLLDYWPLGREWTVDGETGGRQGAEREIANHRATNPPFTTFLRLVLEKIPSCCWLRRPPRSRSWPSGPVARSSLWNPCRYPQRIARAAVLYVAYLGKTLWPVNLAAMYPDGGDGELLAGVGAGVLLALLTAGALWGAWRGQRWLAVGWFWYLGTLVPTIGLVQVGSQVMADRFLYLPQIGLCMALVWGVGGSREREKGRKGEREKGSYSPAPFLPFSPPLHRPPSTVRYFLPAISSALLLAGLIVLAWRQTGYWRNSETLWIHTLACTTQTATAQMNLGCALADRGQFDEAIAQYRKALEIEPDHVNAHYNLGLALVERGQVEEAIAHYRKALDINPDYALVHVNLGNALAGRGKLDEAREHYQTALALATAQNDRALADVIAAEIRSHRPGASAGHAP